MKVDAALAAQATGGEPGRLGEILNRQQVATEEHVLKAVALQFDLEFRSRLNIEEIEGSLIGAAGLPLAYALTHRLLPIKRLAEGTVLTAVVDPTNTSALDEARMMLGAPLALCLSTSGVLIDAIHAAVDRAVSMAHLQATFSTAGKELPTEEEFRTIDTSILDPNDDAPIIRLVNALLLGAVKARASDIHLEPYEHTLVVRYRVDGILKRVVELPKRVQNAVIGRIKVMGGLDIAEKRLPQDGRLRITHAGRDFDVRLSTAPMVFGERSVMRLLAKSSEALNLQELGLDEQQRATIQCLIDRPHGIILVTGPTGSGKTTTLYAALSRLNEPGTNIMTIEDPVEYQLPGISQMPVNPKIGLSFADGLRCFLRQDPDVIMVGEIRDPETAEIAVQASLTGHLVLSSVHTNDAASSITRLVDMGVEPFLVASSLAAVIAQRLARRVCQECRVPRSITRDELLLAQVPEARVDHFLGGRFFKARPEGCEACAGTGYRGRTGLYEIMLVNDEVRALIIRNADSNTIKQAAMRGQGMALLREDGVKRASQGLTTLEEIMGVTETEIE